MDIITRTIAEEFRKWLLLYDLSRDTATSYARSVISYALGKSFGDVNSHAFFLSLRARLQETGRRRGTVSRHIYAFKKFLFFLSEVRKIPIVNTSSIRCKHPSKPDPVYLEHDEIRAIRALPVIHGTGNRMSSDALRDRTIFEVLLSTGCRISEIVETKWATIDFGRQELLVRGKGDKERVVFLGASTSWVKRYLESRVQRSEWLFTTWQNRKLDRKDATKAIAKLGERAHLEKRIYSHMIRTTFATHMIRCGVDPRTLQEMMGHEDIETTLRQYVGVSRDRMRESHKVFQRVMGP